jgi:hypothetical protein
MLKKPVLICDFPNRQHGNSDLIYPICVLNNKLTEPVFKTFSAKELVLSLAGLYDNPI